MNINKPIINYFSKTYQNVVQTYCDNINNCDADIFIIMARKGVCFFDLLKDDGLIKLSTNQKIISSNALEYMPNISKTTKVVVTDDIMISGTSISDVLNTLLDLGVPAANISVIVLAIDSENMNIGFSTETQSSILHSSWTLTNDDCIELSSQISNILALFGRPYDVDFPVYNSVTISKQTLKKVLRPDLWNIYNITNPYQAEGKIDVLTLIPTKSTNIKIWEHLGFSTNYFAHIKYRIYLKDIDSETVSIQLVPFMLFNEMKYAQIDELCAVLTGNSFPQLCYTAKLRICQFVLCHNLSLLFSEWLQNQVILSLRNDVITNLFGYELAETIRKVLDNQTTENNRREFKYNSCEPDLLDYSDNSSSTMLDPSQNYSFHVIERDDRKLNIQLLQPFISWYLTRELPTRNELKTGNYHFRHDRELIKDKTYRLAAGYSLQALNCIFIDKDNLYRWPDVMSIFLDRAIDMGIIVPIMFHNTVNKTVCRAFRHGEDLPFGIADKSRLLYFLQQLQKEFAAKKCEGIAWISFEKIIVLFIQMALRDKGIFNQFLGFRNNEVLSIRYSVHGAVATKIDAQTDTTKLKFYFDAASYWDWITSYLREAGIIEQRNTPESNPNDYIRADSFVRFEKQFNNICNEIQVKIKKYAALFAEWYAAMHRGKRNDFKKQVIQLSTCFSLPTVSAALATELHYFSRYWDEDVVPEIDKYFNRPHSNFMFKVVGEDTSKVLNSGREKYGWYERQSYINAISTVKKLLERNNSYMSADWEGQWHPIASTKRKEDPYLAQLYHECYCCLLICCACYEILSHGELNTDTKEPSQDVVNKIRRYREEFNLVSENNNLNLDDYEKLFDIFETQIFKYNNLKNQLSVLRQKMDCLMRFANKNVEKIQELVSQQIIDLPVYYGACIIVELQCMDEAKCSWILDEAWDALPNNKDKTFVNIFKLKEASGINDYLRYGIFYEITDDISNEDLLILFNQLILYIYTQTKTHHINSRFMVIPQLPSTCRLKYSYKSNMTKDIDNFNSMICDPLVPYCNKDSFSQIIVAHNAEQFPYDIVNNHICINMNVLCEGPFELDPKVISWPSPINYSLTKYYSPKCHYSRLDPQDAVHNSIACLSYDKQILGTITLLNYNNTIIGITCKHCISNDPDIVYKIKLKKHNKFFLYGTVISCDCDPNEELSALEEVALLKLYWDSKCTIEAYLEKETILNMDSNMSSQESTDFSCFGYPSNRGFTIHATNYYEANDGYYEFAISRGEKVQNGFSGALFIDKNNIPVAMVYSYQNYGEIHAYGIPMSTVIQRIKELMNKNIKEEELL